MEEQKIVEYPEIGKMYRHYKGGSYTVMSIAKHTETNEILVICKSEQFGSFHARPLNIWFDTIKYGTISTPRFTLIN